MGMILLSVVAFFIAIGILVAVHEWGHYIAAKMLGVKVLRYSIGFGKALWMRRSGPDQTEYCLAAIPLGGYVKLLDEREGEVARHEIHRAFNRQPIFSRIVILVAGPFMNFVFAIAAYWMMFMVGVPGLIPYVGDVEAGSIAANAGLQTRDRIIAVDDQPVATWEGATLAIIDGMLDKPAVRMEVVDEQDRAKTVFLEVAGKVNSLTEPGNLFIGLGFSPWSPDIEPILGEIAPGEAAEEAGLKTGDKILSAAGTAFRSWSEWVQYVQLNPDQAVELIIERDKLRTTVELAIASIERSDGSVIGRIGAGPLVPEDFYQQYSADQRYGLVAGLPVALDRTWSMSALTIRMVSRMVTGEVSVKNISGPINIAQYAGYSAAIGLSSFLNFLAVVSLSLGILNLLPIPILDGGQIVYQLCEAVKGSPLSQRAQLIGQQLGIVFLMMVMSFAFYNDLTRVFS